MRKFALILALALLLGACTFSQEPTDPLVDIQTSPGKEFKVRISANPTTGYHWEIVGDLDENVVQFVSRDYQPEMPQTTGSGGTDVWTFKAVAPGETQITLGYFPPSQDATEPGQTETFNVIVK